MPMTLEGIVERGPEDTLDIAQRHAILRAPRTGQARLNRTQIELEQLVELRVRRLIGAEESLLLAVLLDQLDLRFVAARQAQIGQRLVIDREQACLLYTSDAADDLTRVD